MPKSSSKPPKPPALIARETAAELRTVSSQLDHWSAGRFNLVLLPPEQFGAVLRSLARDADKAVIAEIGKDEFQRRNRRYHG